MKNLILTSLATFALAAFASAGELVNVDKHGLALQGYDPVGYFTESRPVEGNPSFSTTYKGALYHFASSRNRALFLRNPAKYEPQFGGFCGYAASIDTISEISPHYWQILNGRLVLQHNQKAWNLWTRDVAGNLAKADGNWPHLKAHQLSWIDRIF
ncbi:MAG: YHS domain-containing (seleno)protein [Chthoniobacter sp.]|uniref:YHS domain-containing (seleno)protein n=1 Tax=Chthoniobacter sp. TaxID=2510640 RepID=UPI0032A5D4B9